MTRKPGNGNMMKTKDPPPQETLPEAMEHPGEHVQTPLPGLGAKMEAMKARADEVLSRTRRSGPPEACFRQDALEIFLAMRPEFGPANAWLFNEREKKIEQLALKWGLGPEAADLIQDHVYEPFCHDFVSLEQAVRALGFETRVRSAERGELMWIPAPGLALTVQDPDREVDWQPPYAGTPAGPEVDLPIKRHPTLTLFTFLPWEGKAVRHLLRREQPGLPVFFTGGLIAYTLQEPQSHDVEPDKILESVLDEIRKGGLLFNVPADALGTIRKITGARLKSVENREGIIWVASDAAPPKDKLEALKGCAVMWVSEYDTNQQLSLVLP